ncbi:hypothetical protein G159_02115 [Planococcus glaciei CHR43]|uniref:hypothetical protein n=1 Tax=Planococcus glaciei TaxID=459472 RepID=UPI0003DF0481|nr:hypothetical protein [Planococcus glaciei]ETP70346.1 hypothetical protein G159_02115 [Planococcus glaciei CHR43]
MKVHFVILFLVIISAAYIGLNITNQPVTSPSPTEGDSQILQEVSPQQSPDITSPIDPSYVMDYLESIGFILSPVFEGDTTDIYTAKYTIPDSHIGVQVDVYFERSSQQVLLIESNIDASWYVRETDQQYYEDYVNKAARNLFGSFATLPYVGSNPEAAREWVESNIITSYSTELPGKTTTIIGPATINLFGSPLLRTLEIDFGF